MKAASDEEARHLAQLFEGRTAELAGFLSSQLSVLRSQAQTYLGIAGVCISVTGFAGHNMVNAGMFASACMIGGIGLILGAIVLSLRSLSAIRWVSEDLGQPATALAAAVIKRRNEQQRQLGRAGGLIGFGLAFYLLAVVIAAVARGHWSPP